ncbi:MAG: hypothetical protein IIB53_12865 [Planctomycetes bacterium]|nr:hypothetical protein [Planctomycetota bacterium]
MTARDLVTSRIAARARRFPDLDLTPLDTAGLDRRDAALAFAIDRAVARRWLTLITVIESQLNRSWPSLQPQVQAALLVGTAQLLLLERLPDHAVINEAVQWTKVNAGPKPAGLVNAALRKVAAMRQETVAEHDPKRRDEVPLHDGRARRLSHPIFEADPLPRLAQQTSHPVELLKRWADRFGLQRSTELAQHSILRPPILVTALGAAHQGCEPHDEPGFAVFSGDHRELEALLEAHPPARVQDPATAAAVNATADLRPKIIVDACAGKGTKARQLHETHPHARIIASDKNADRLATLRAVADRTARLEVVEPGRMRDLVGQVDLLVLDVPCSNTAVLARRPEAKYRFGPDSLSQLVDLQRQIIADHLSLLAESGHLLYSTCSLEPQENEAQAQWIVRWHGLRIRRENLRLPQGLPGEPSRRYTDGGYFALLQKK